MQWCTSYDINWLKWKHHPIPSSKMRVSPCHGNPTRAVSQIKFQIWDTSGIIQHHSTSLSGQEKSAMTSPPFSSVLSRIEFGGFPTAMFIEGSTKTLPFTTPATGAFHPSVDGVMLRLYWRARWRTVPERTKETLQQQRSDKVSGTSQTCLVPSAQDKLPPSTPGLVLGLSIFVGPFWRYLDIRY